MVGVGKRWWKLVKVAKNAYNAGQWYKKWG